MLGPAVFFPSANNPQSLIARSSPSFIPLNHKHSKAFFNVRASCTDFPLASRIIVRNITSYSSFAGLLTVSAYLSQLAFGQPKSHSSSPTPSLNSFAFSIPRTGKYDLSHSTNEINLKKEFSNFGEVAEVKLVKDESGKRSKGYAFIQYTSQDDAMLALENLDCRYIDGRTVFLELAKPSRKQYGRYPSASGPPPTMLQDSS